MKKIKIIYTMTAPVSHIGQTASVGAYFNTLTTAYGEIPVITGNAVRGTLRDFGAKKILDTYNKRVDKETFNVLFSGGNISGATKNDVARAKQVRAHFPLVSLMGGGLGSMLMAGTMLSGFLYPVCTETVPLTKIESKVSWHELVDEIEFTRMDDTKDDAKEHYLEDVNEDHKAKASTQMRYSVQYIAAGTQFVQEIVLLDSATELEESVLYSSLFEWFKIHTIGGMRAKGFGFFDAHSDEIQVVDGHVTMSDRVSTLIKSYDEFLSSEDIDTTIQLLTTGGKKND